MVETVRKTKPTEGFWDGRLTRSGFVVRSLLALAVAVVLRVAEQICGQAIEESAVLAIFVLLLAVALSVWQVSIACRRLNDVHSSRWLTLFMFVPLVNLIFWVWLACAKSEGDGSNGAQ